MRGTAASRACGLALLWAAVALTSATPAGATPEPPSKGKEPRLDARAWALIDAGSGERLARHAAARRLPIASTTKLMTAHLALERLPLRRRIVAPRYAAGAAESVLGIEPGERLTVRDLIYALVLRSANDAAVTLATGVSGSQRRFVRAMNRSAAALGLTGTHYTTPVGLDERGNHSTADDLVALARRLLDNRVFARAANSRDALLRSGRKRRRIVTRNTLELEEPWVTGVKTGHTLDAGYVLVASGRRKGVELIAAVLGASSEASRDTETRKLLEYGFSLYRLRDLVREGATVATPEVSYRSGKLALIAERSLRITVRGGQRVATRVQAPAKVEGPIAAGDALGRVFASVDGREAGSVPLVAARAVPAASLARKAASRALLPVALVAVGAFVIVVGLRRRPRARAAATVGRDRAVGQEELEKMREDRRRMREERRRTGKERQP